MILKNNYSVKLNVPIQSAWLIKIETSQAPFILIVAFTIKIKVVCEGLILMRLVAYYKKLI